jgi:hypothetical protein
VARRRLVWQADAEQCHPSGVRRQRLLDGKKKASWMKPGWLRFRGRRLLVCRARVGFLLVESPTFVERGHGSGQACDYSPGTGRPTELVFLAHESRMSTGEAEISARSLAVVASLGC